MRTMAREPKTNDIYLDGTGQIAFVSSKTCHAQIIEAMILTVRRELQLDVTRGIPYFDTVFESRRFARDWADSVERAITSLPWVVSIREFDYRFDGGDLIYNIEVSTDDGEIVSIENSLGSQLIIPSGGGQEMDNLTDANGNFYLPVQKVDGVQQYRKLTAYISEEWGNSTQVSSELYVKDANGNFVVVS